MSHEISLSEKETNELRAKLGLPVLSVSQSGGQNEKGQNRSAPKTIAPVEALPEREATAEGAPADGATSFIIKHDLPIKEGEEITLTLADSHVLDDGDLTVQDARLAEMQKFAGYAEERAKIQEHLSACGRHGERFEGDEEILKPITVRALPSKKERSLDHIARSKAPDRTVKKTGFKQRKTAGRSAKIDWSEVFAEGSETAEGDVVSPNAAEVFTKPRSWSFAGASEADPEMDQLLDLIKDSRLWVKKETAGGVAERDSIDPTAKTAVVDTKEETSKVGEKVEDGGDLVLMTKTREFVKSVQTPLERLEEAKNQRRGVVNVSANPAAETIEPPHLDAVMEQESLTGGLSQTLRYLKDTGNLKEDIGRHTNKEGYTPLHKSTEKDEIKLDYFDPWGKVVGPKDAFRLISYRFHGKGPGKRKVEKKLLKMGREKELKTKAPEEVMPTLRALKSQQAKGDAYLVLNAVKK